MENTNDSGIDSDQKNSLVLGNGSGDFDDVPSFSFKGEKINISGDPDSSSDIDNSSGSLNQTPEKNSKAVRHGFLSHTRLLVPRSKQQSKILDPVLEPLVLIETDESEDEFAVTSLSKEAQKELTQQLIQDGYDIQVDFEDPDLDLKPPRPLHQRCYCCGLLPSFCVIM